MFTKNSKTPAAAPVEPPKVVTAQDAVRGAATKSAARAASVGSALVKQGVEAGRLTTGGFGETQPKGNNATLDGRALNRRVELLRTDR